MDTRRVVESVADDVLRPDSIKEFIDKSFMAVLLDRDLKPEQTQARASVTGDTFEVCIEVLFERLFSDITIKRNVDLPDALMTGAGGADFVLYYSDGTIAGVIEAKGSADKLEWPDGTVKEPSRPGLQRSDTMKKAVCQAYQVSQGLDDIPFYILTSHKPKPTSTVQELYDMAVGDIIDSVALVYDIDEIEYILDDAGL